jgi:hypothetical protein
MAAKISRQNRKKRRRRKGQDWQVLDSKGFIFYHILIHWLINGRIVKRVGWLELLLCCFYHMRCATSLHNGRAHVFCSRFRLVIFSPEHWNKWIWKKISELEAVVRTTTTSAATSAAPARLPGEDDSDSSGFR